MYRIIDLIPQNSEEDYNKILPAFLSIWNNPENNKYLSLTLQQFTEGITGYWFKNHLDLGGRYFAAVDDKNDILGFQLLKSTRLKLLKFRTGCSSGFKNKRYRFFFN
jgi:hypothetical protein